MAVFSAKGTFDYFDIYPYVYTYTLLGINSFPLHYFASPFDGISIKSILTVQVIIRNSENHGSNIFVIVCIIHHSHSQSKKYCALQSTSNDPQTNIILHTKMIFNPQSKNNNNNNNKCFVGATFISNKVTKSE